MPAKSSGARWSVEEDERLYQALLQLATQFPDRSVSAILTRMDYLKVAWWRRRQADGT